MAALNFQFNSGPPSPPRYFQDDSYQPSAIERTAQQIANEQGLPLANFFLARCFDVGEGVAQNRQQAAEYYYAAAEGGLAEAQQNLACCFLNGEGVAVNLKSALYYFVAAANQGYAPAIYNLGNLMEEKDPNRAAKYYTKAALKGHAQAYYSLACMYDSGKGIPQNYEEAARLYFHAAELGLPEAQYNLACSYDMGQGVGQDFSEAVKYYTFAADQGHAMAQFNLAQCYHHGKGVAMNQAGAIHYYELASQQGIAVPNITPNMIPSNQFQTTFQKQQQPTWNNNLQQSSSLRSRSVSFQLPQTQQSHTQLRVRSQTQGGRNVFGNGRSRNAGNHHNTNNATGVASWGNRR